jgi:hypothetical protein
MKGASAFLRCNGKSMTADLTRESISLYRHLGKLIANRGRDETVELTSLTNFTKRKKGTAEKGGGMGKKQ